MIIGTERVSLYRTGETPPTGFLDWIRRTSAGWALPVAWQRVVRVIEQEYNWVGAMRMA